MRMLLVLGLSVLISGQSLAATVCSKDVCVNAVVVSKMDDLRRGLQGKSGLQENEGMLFVFDQDDRYRFWMKDMQFSIDMLWLDKEGKIVTIAEDVPPCAPDHCPTYAPDAPSRYVLEVASRYSSLHHFKVGDKLEIKGI